MLRCQTLMRGAVLVMFTVNMSGSVRCCAISSAWREPIGFVVGKDKECDSCSCFFRRIKQQTFRLLSPLRYTVLGS